MTVGVFGRQLRNSFDDDLGIGDAARTFRDGGGKLSNVSITRVVEHKDFGLIQSGARFILCLA
jgi:hypothetical protein